MNLSTRVSFKVQDYIKCLKMTNVMDKRALMIAPSYCNLGKDHDLTALKSDVQVMTKTLIEKCGFKEDNFTVLQGPQATKDNILKAFSELTNCKDGSVVFVFYTGHGAYLPDSQDEGLFPTVPKWPTDRPLEEVCITGQDLRPYFEELSSKQVRCTLIFDCCHSGQLYRDVDQLEGFKIKQFVAKSGDNEPEPEHKPYTKDRRGGWIPGENDHFFYFAACSSVQKAREMIDKGGVLTMAVVNTLKSLESSDKVTYTAFFRLLMKEFKENGWDNMQSPQFEGANSDTVLFGVSSVKQPEGGIDVIEVPHDDEVVLNAGFLQNLAPGKYFVYAATVAPESVMQGTSSKDWLGTIQVHENMINQTTAVGWVSKPDGKITVGCLAFLDEPDTINNNLLVCPAEQGFENKLQSLVERLKDSDMLNVLKQKVDDPDLITLACETVESKSKWVARRRGKMLVPPISVDVNRAESIMANNVCKHIRYNVILDMAKPPEDEEILLENVTLKIFKVEKVQSSNKKAIAYGLEKGLEVTRVTDRRVFFKAHQDKHGKPVPGTGDSFIYQVINDNKTVDEVVHICIILYQSDGSIVPIYPPRKGGTIPLRGGDTVEGILPLIIPKDTLRAMAEPDPAREEPDTCVDTLVLYASSKQADYGPILQSPIEIDPKELLKGRNTDPLSSLDKFLKLKKRPVPANDVEGKMKYTIKKVPIFTKK